MCPDLFLWAPSYHPPPHPSLSLAVAPTHISYNRSPSGVIWSGPAQSPLFLPTSAKQAASAGAEATRQPDGRSVSSSTSLGVDSSTRAGCFRHHRRAACPDRLLGPTPSFFIYYLAGLVKGGLCRLTIGSPSSFWPVLFGLPSSSTHHHHLTQARAFPGAHIRSDSRC